MLITPEKVYYALRLAMLRGNKPNHSAWSQHTLDDSAESMKRIMRDYDSRSPVTQSIFIELARLLNQEDAGCPHCGEPLHQGLRCEPCDEYAKAANDGTLMSSLKEVH